jgi:hypothetical protein
MSAGTHEYKAPGTRHQAPGTAPGTKQKQPKGTTGEHRYQVVPVCQRPVNGAMLPADRVRFLVVFVDYPSDSLPSPVTSPLGCESCEDQMPAETCCRSLSCERGQVGPEMVHDGICLRGQLTACVCARMYVLCTPKPSSAWRLTFGDPFQRINSGMDPSATSTPSSQSAPASRVPRCCRAALYLRRKLRAQKHQTHARTQHNNTP